MSNQIYTTNMLYYILEITFISNEWGIKESEKQIFMKKIIGFFISFYISQKGGIKIFLK